MYHIDNIILWYWKINLMIKVLNYIDIYIKFIFFYTCTYIIWVLCDSGTFYMFSVSFTRSSHSEVSSVLLRSKKRIRGLSRIQGKKDIAIGGSEKEAHIWCRGGTSDCYLWWMNFSRLVMIFQAKWRPGWRVKSGRVSVLSFHCLLLFVLSNPSVYLSSRRRVAAPNAFRSRGADYIDRFMMAALLQGLGGITWGRRKRGDRVKRLPSFTSSTAGCRYILVDESTTSREPLSRGRYTGCRVNRENGEGRIFLPTLRTDFRAS